MPGSYATDALAPNLLTGATLNAAGTTNSTAVDLDRPGCVRFRLVTGTVTGTTPTLSVELQGCDSSNFSSTPVVSYGRFASVGDEDDETRYLSAEVHHQYLRAVVVAGGTSPSFAGSVLTVLPEHTLWSRPDSA